MPRSSLVGCLSLLLVAAVLGGRCPAQETLTAEQQAEVRQWIEQLGDNSFSVREVATSQLCDMGLPVLPLLEEGQQLPDLEIRYRCERLLVEIRERERLRRIEDFLAGRVRTDEAELPCWSRVQEMLGTGDDARRLYGQMLKSQWYLLVDVHEHPGQTARLVGNACTRLQRTANASQQPIDLGSVATILFFAAEHEQAPLPISSYTYNFCMQQPIGREIKQGDYSASLRQMLSQWIERHDLRNNVYEPLNIAMRYDLPAGLEPARTILADPTQPAKQWALLVIADLGDTSDLPLLDNLLDDQTVWSNIQMPDGLYQCRYCDVALVTQMFLLQQDPAEFGFTHLSRHTGNEIMPFNPTFACFSSEESRQQALDGWQAWREAHPLPTDDAPENGA